MPVLTTTALPDPLCMADPMKRMFSIEVMSSPSALTGVVTLETGKDSPVNAD
jgi:hypothetical protein